MGDFFSHENDLPKYYGRKNSLEEILLLVYTDCFYGINYPARYYMG
jgi:hypothetical protein